MAVLLLITVALSGCIDNPVVIGKGTVKYIYLEGGFYGIIWDIPIEKIKYLEPENLPQDLMEDGLRVKFIVKLKPDASSFKMWGIATEIIKIEKIN